MKTVYEYMIGLPAAERTENVKAMVNIILLDVEIDINMTYDEAYADGQEKGFAEGLAESQDQ